MPISSDHPSPLLPAPPSRPPADLHRSSEAQARSLQGTQKDLVAARDQVASLGAAQAELHEERGRLQAELASARQQAAAAQQAQQEADQQRAAVQERLTLAESALGDSRQLAANAQEQHAEAAAAAAEMRQQLAAAQQAAAEAQQRLAAAAGEKQEWAQQRGELQEQVAALQKAQAVADGKLVVARQREAQFKVQPLKGSCVVLNDMTSAGSLLCRAVLLMHVALSAQCFLGNRWFALLSPANIGSCAGGIQAAEGAAAGAAGLCV